ncbi:hypothetical protein M422DRAFT_266725 [Sphaerobolus stellatus SS14]|uniref:Uncharacterized protein n=1 Tax=Sphaerobolus stellatus (strain SS14) TaxID=990650 RepID=A0A0C9V264_SPHS4|nr:hypothetical protein M422DRAFT_266725 [Sphaerobolus stellatus SS14]
MGSFLLPTLVIIMLITNTLGAPGVGLVNPEGESPIVHGIVAFAQLYDTFPAPYHMSPPREKTEVAEGFRLEGVILERSTTRRWLPHHVSEDVFFLPDEHLAPHKNP